MIHVPDIVRNRREAIAIAGFSASRNIFTVVNAYSSLVLVSIPSLILMLVWKFKVYLCLFQAIHRKI